MESARPDEIEPLSNRLLIHRVARLLLPRAIAIGLHPNLVSAAGLSFGLLAALAYTNWRDWRWATVGLLLMLCWHIMDGLDGKLARATGKCSALGRLLDGVADYSTFVAVNLALAFTHPAPALAVSVAIGSGICHALQSQFYEGERATYIRRRDGNFAAIERTVAGGAVERLYNRCEAMLGNRTRRIDRLLAAAPAAGQAAILARWRPSAARVLRAMSPLSANGRTLAIWIAALAGDPMLYWIWEIGPLTLLALIAARTLRNVEAKASLAS